MSGGTCTTHPSEHMDLTVNSNLIAHDLNSDTLVQNFDL